MTHIVVTVPIRLESVANVREHWSKRAARAKSHRLQAWAALRDCQFWQKLSGPVEVTLTRIAPRQLDGHDNLRTALKATVDGVADWLGMDDSDERLKWQYAQERGAPKHYACRIEVKA